MNNIINKFLIAGDKFMPEMNWGQPRFMYNACGPLKQKQKLDYKKLRKLET